MSEDSRVDDNGRQAREAQRLREQNLYSIPPGTPFLPTLAAFLLDQQTADGTPLFAAPGLLSKSIIFLPTRRAAKAFGLALQSAVEARTKKRATLLPRIATFGDPDETEKLEEISLGAMDDGAMLAASLERDPVPDSIERALLLARLTKGWTEVLSRKSLELIGERERVLPSSSADAIWLARDLADLMDQMETEEISWQAIGEIEPEDRQGWWQLTLGFLEIVTRSWPQLMRERGYISPSTLRRQLTDLRIAQLLENPPEGIVLAAGSTGSVPTTARLLKAIAGLKNGRVVLPGLDSALPEDVVRSFRESPENATEAVLSTHAQFGLCRLLASLQVQNTVVRTVGRVTGALQIRERVLSAAMLPPDATESWFRLRNDLGNDAIGQAMAGIALIEAPDERTEALAIALALRETLQTPGKLAALVTPDRNLARRVSTELERFDIEIDDSAGTPISATPVYRFVRAVLRAAIIAGSADEDAVLGLAELIHHPLIFDGEIQSLSGFLDVAALRTGGPPATVETLSQTLGNVERALAEPGHHPAVLKRLSQSDWQRLRQIATEIENRIQPLVVLLGSSTELAAQQLAATLIQVAAALNTPLAVKEGEESAQPNGTALYAGAGGTELRAYLERAAGVEDVGYTFHPTEALPVFDALTAGLVVREAVRTHPRLFILGTLEARLQSFDRVILGGLNEGAWPATLANDPFLNRPIRAELTLPLPERRVGLAAHDFAQLSGAPEVFYTRSTRSAGPTVASRWLQRLGMFIGKGQTTALQARGRRFLAIAEQLDRPSRQAQTLSRTRATPPAAVRPKEFSITEIETFIRDPYAIYAKHVLSLQALPALLANNEAAMRGSIYHRVVERFTKEAHGTILAGDSAAAQAAMMALIDEELTDAAIAPEVASAWRKRFEAIAVRFIEWESERAPSLAESHVEVSLPRTPIGNTGATLRGRADRIDIAKDGTLHVIDYKTGTRPSTKEARTIAPQLPLTAAFAAAGKFDGVPAGDIGSMAYVRLRDGEKFQESIATDRGGDKRTAPQIAAEAMRMLSERIAAFDDATQPYWSQLIPDAHKRYKGDFDYLARIKEWSIGAGDEEGEGGDR